MKRFLYSTAIIYLFSTMAFADVANDPCGPANFLNIIDRPTASDSACAVDYKKVVIEMGYQYAKMSHSGYSQSIPLAELRIGLPANNEVVMLLPSHINLSTAPHTGFTATSVGIKHELGYTSNLTAAIESLVTLPTGSQANGSEGTGVTVAGVVSYSYTPKLNFTLQIGASNLTQPKANGGGRYTSVNPDVVATYSVTDRFDVYAEAYGQTRTAPQEGSGFLTDGGVIYLLRSNVEVDAELGQRINGNLAGIDHYVATGLSVQF